MFFSFPVFFPLWYNLHYNLYHDERERERERENFRLMYIDALFSLLVPEMEYGGRRS